MLLFHEVCHSFKIYLLMDGLKLENRILKGVGSNESDVFAVQLDQRLVRKLCINKLMGLQFEQLKLKGQP